MRTAMKKWWLAGWMALLAGQAAAGELETQAAIKEQIGAAFARGDYAAIESRYAAALTASERTSSGLFVAGAVVGAVLPAEPRTPAAAPGRDDFWNPIEEKVRQWKAAFPQSALVAVVQSRVAVDHGWAWRGGGYSNSVAPEDRKKLDVYLGRAFDALQQSEAVGRQDPYWYAQMLAVARVQSWPQPAYMALVQQAVTAFPNNHEIYFAVAHKMLPRWGGSAEAVALVADFAAGLTRKTEGDALYARVYWSVHGMLDADFHDRRVNWRRVRAGFDDLVKRYPDRWNLNHFARFACEAGDMATTHRILLRIQDDAEPKAWPTRATYNRCRQAAKLPMPRVNGAYAVAPQPRSPAAPSTAVGEPLTSLDQVNKAYHAQRYAALERFYAELVRDRKREKYGSFEFEKFLLQLPLMLSNDPNDGMPWDEVDASTRAWIAHSPKSHLAAIVRATALMRRAKVVESAGGSWAEADQLALQARRVLEATRATGVRDANWHEEWLWVADTLGTPRAEVMAAVKAAVGADPYPVGPWVAASRALSPDGTSTGDLDSLLRLAVERTHASEGLSMYPRILAETYWHFPEVHNNPFGRGGLHWPALRQGFADLRQRYPADYKPDMLGALACLAGDKEATAQALQQAGARPKADTWLSWGGRTHLERCRKWAYDGAPGRPT